MVENSDFVKEQTSSNNKEEFFLDSFLKDGEGNSFIINGYLFLSVCVLNFYENKLPCSVRGRGKNFFEAIQEAQKEYQNRNRETT